MTQNQKKVGAFLKFGELNHLQQLQEEGLIYCNTLDYFANLEKVDPACDPYENVTMMKNLGEAKIKLWPAEEPMPENPVTIKSEWTQYQQHHFNMGNIFCSHFVDLDSFDDQNEINIDTRNGRKGNYFLAISDINKFVSRFREAAGKKGHYIQTGMVNYKDLKYHTGAKGIFEKDLRFAHEKEWRAFLTPGSSTAVEIKIGSIKSISKLMQGDLTNIKLFLLNKNTLGLNPVRAIK